MIKPYLAVTCGYPCTGKTEIARYLRDELGFAWFNSDPIREESFGVHDYLRHVETKFGQQIEEAIYEIMDGCKFSTISRGIDVVIDTSAPKQHHRERFMSTMTHLGPLRAQPYLIHMTASRDILVARNYNKGRDGLEAVALSDRQFEQPVEGPYTLLRYENNTPHDLRLIKADLLQKLGEKPKIFIP